MTPLPPVSHVLQLRTFFTIGDKLDQGVRQFYRWSGTTPTAAILEQLCTQINAAAIAANIRGMLSDYNYFTGTELTDLTTDMGAQNSVRVTHIGTRGGTKLPAEAAFVTSFEIPRRYRGGHPRSYWPFGVEGDVDTPNQWTSASQTAFTTCVAAYIGATVGQSNGGTTVGAHCSIAYYHGFTVVTDPITHRARNVPTKRTPPVVTTVTRINGRSYIGSFRRRRIKVS